MKLIKFYSDTCVPCRLLEQNLQKTDIEYVSVNCNDDSNESLVEKYNISSVPVLVKEEDGREIARHNGVMTVQQIKDWYYSNSTADEGFSCGEGGCE